MLGCWLINKWGLSHPVFSSHQLFWPENIQIDHISPELNNYILMKPPHGLDAPKFIMQVAMSCLCVYAFRLCSFEFEPQQLKNELKRKSNSKIASRLHYTDWNVKNIHEHGNRINNILGEVLENNLGIIDFDYLICTSFFYHTELWLLY